MKPVVGACYKFFIRAFSILERIDVGETSGAALPGAPLVGALTFSILERIDVGETRLASHHPGDGAVTFSILERIDVGETRLAARARVGGALLSVSSNGSTWVKREAHNRLVPEALAFQYPRTDRRG